MNPLSAAVQTVTLERRRVRTHTIIETHGWMNTALPPVAIGAHLLVVRNPPVTEVEAAQSRALGVRGQPRGLTKLAAVHVRTNADGAVGHTTRGRAGECTRVGYLVEFSSGFGCCPAHQLLGTLDRRL